jgi:transcriptional adapter 2-alpha
MKNKSPVECEVHYFQTYLASDSAPFPVDDLLPEAVLPPPPDFDTTPRESRPSIAHERNLAERNKKERTTPAEYAGWMPRRLEFEVEYLNDAEQIVSGITFAEGDDPANFEQKLSCLRAYNEKLEERQIRTNFAMEWDLLEQEFRSFGSRSKTEREMEESLMPLAQVVPRDILTKLIESVFGEMRLQEQIETLKKWRKNGIVTRDEGLLFNELEKLMKEDKLSPSAIEKWNREVQVYAESPEFRATLDRQLLSQSENQLCQSFGLSPHSYLNLKDLLLREYSAKGEMNRELAVSFMPCQETVMVAVYETLKNAGLFYSMADLGVLPLPGTEEREPEVEGEGEIPVPQLDDDDYISHEQTEEDSTRQSSQDVSDAEQQGSGSSEE